jgi:FKBP-type peptidyl-prolyl cis-trans isomerase FklB
MKTIIKLVTVCFLTTAVCLLQGCSTHSQPSKQADGISGTNLLSDAQSRYSYAVGMMIAQRWKLQGFEFNDDVFFRGLKDGQFGTNTLMTGQEMSNTLRQVQQDMMAKQVKMRAELAAKNKAEGEAFLATNKNNSGVVTLPDGLQYKILTDGTGKIPRPVDTVSVNYRGTLINGTEFDSSYKSGQPAQFQLSGEGAEGIILGWIEALEQMKVGSKWRVFIPPRLAYGEQGGPGIPPNSTLIFDFELVGIKPAPPATPPPTVTSDIIKVPSADQMKQGAKVEVIKADQVEKLENQATNTAK